MLWGINHVLIGLNTILQITAAYLAFRLVKLPAWRISWILVGIAVLLRSTLEFVQINQPIAQPSLPVTLALEMVELVVSTILIASITAIRPLFSVTRRAEDIYQLFVQKSVQGLVIFQKDHIVFANPSFAYLTGCTMDELVKLSSREISQLFHPEDRDYILRLLTASALDSPSQKREVRLLNKRGITFWLETFFSRSMYAGESALQITCVNITDRKRIEQELHESERRHRIISQLTSDYIYSARVGSDNQVVYEWVSGAFDRITGYTLEDLSAVGREIKDLSHPDDKLKSVEAHTYALSNQPVVIEYRVISKHGEIVWLRDYMQPIWSDYENRVTHIIGAVQDITNRKTAEKALRDSEGRWRGLAENAPTVIATVDMHHRIQWMNRPLNKPLEETINRDFHTLLPPNERARFHRALRSVFADGAAQRQEVQLKNAEGQSSWYEIIIGPITEENVVISAILVMTDNTERKNAEEQLKFLSNHDTLTGLYNRAYFETELHRLQNSRSYPITIVMADVNNLKKTNDEFGHAMGDELLQTMAQAMRESFRSEDVVARIGGDEFAILLPETDEEPSRAILERLNHRLQLLNNQSRTFPLSLSIGAATGQNNADLLQVLKQADNLMYENKARQKNTSPLKPEPA